MKEDQRTGSTPRSSDSPSPVRLAQTAIDRGEILTAEAHIADGRLALAGEDADVARSALALDIQEASIALYRGEVELAMALAERCRSFAEERFEDPGIEVGRARLQVNFAREARLEFASALEQNLRLEVEMVEVPGAIPLRLHCLTRAIACAIKNADRLAISELGFRAAALRAGLTWQEHGRILAWYHLWIAVASLRQGQILEVKYLLDHVEEQIEDPGWRWCNAAGFIEGHLGMQLDGHRLRAVEVLSTVISDARKRNFHGHLRSIDAGVNGPEV